MLLITGANGQLGSALKAKYPDSIATTRELLDVTDLDAVLRFVDKNLITKIINCTAYNFVDKAEEEIEECFKVNTTGIENLAKTNLPILHFSTDYVFDGRKTSPYAENNAKNPISIYGKSKAAGEDRLLEIGNKPCIIRICGLYDTTHKNFLTTIIKLAKERAELKIVSDQIISPVYIDDLVEFIELILNKNAVGLYHFSNEGQTSWYEIAAKAVELMHIKCLVSKISRKEYNSVAQRPQYSALDISKAKNEFNIQIPHWDKSLTRAINIIKGNS